MEVKKFYQIVRGAPSAKVAGRWFFRRWGYWPWEVLQAGPVYYVGPLKAEDAEHVAGPLTGPGQAWERSTAKRA